MSVVPLINAQWQRHLVLGDGWRIFVRPIRPDDDHLVRDLLAHVSKEDLRLRFFDSIKEFSHEFIASLTQLDYARAMAFVAIDEASNETLGVVRLHTDLSRKAGEYAKSQGLKRIDGQVLQENSVMLKMCRELGFEIKTDPEDSGVCDVALMLEGG